MVVMEVVLNSRNVIGEPTELSVRYPTIVVTSE